MIFLLDPLLLGDVENCGAIVLCDGGGGGDVCVWGRGDALPYTAL